jgi:hypothetical protein
MSHIETSAEILHLLELQQELKKYSVIDHYFPADGPFRRELYAKHMEFFAAGKKHRERVVSGRRNRCYQQCERDQGHSHATHIKGKSEPASPGKNSSRV